MKARYDASIAWEKLLAEPAPDAPVGSDAELKWRYRGATPSSLRIDAFDWLYPASLYTSNGDVILKGKFGPVSTEMHYPGREFFPYKSIRFCIYTSDQIIDRGWRIPSYEGDRIVDITAECANRLPLSLLDSIRKSGSGSLRLKLRIARWGILVGWDIAYQDPNGPYLRVAYRDAGGDFREAEVVGGSVVRKGWYIDPKTQLRIETDV